MDKEPKVVPTGTAVPALKVLWPASASEIVSVPDKQFKFTSYTYKDINEGADRLAHYYHDQEGLEVRKVGDVDTRLNTTIIAPSAIDYAIHELAFAKMGSSRSPLTRVEDMS